jgi:hypothetical protein
MAIHDEIREQQKKLKGKTFKEKLGYFWDYYKVHTIVALIVVILGGALIRDIVTSKEEAFSATLLNAYGSEGQSRFENDFAAYIGIDTEIYSCFIDTTSTLNYKMTSETDLAIFQRLVAMAQTGGLDVVTGDLMPFTHIAGTGMFLDLRDVLTDEEYARYEPYFYYIDGVLLEDDDDDVTYDSDGSTDFIDTSIDHTDPSSMEKPIPVGIYLPDSAKLKEYGCYALNGETPIFGFIFSSARLETGRQFLQYLTE